MRSLSLPLLLAATLLLGACEDPSNVGIGLVGETGGEPTVVDVPAGTVGPTRINEITGGVARVLAGTVQDPAFGRIAARAFIDVAAVSGMNGDFRNGQVTAAELHLVRTYVYGDTTAPVVLRLLDVPSELDDAGVRADTTLDAGAPIATYTIAPTDSVVVLPLPEAWVAANDTTFRSTSFGTRFHGFAIESASETAVVGFDVATARLRLVEGGDTLSLPVSNQITTLRRDGDVAVGPDRIAIQDGVGPTLRLTFPFGDASAARDAAVNRALVRVTVDTTALDALTPAGFVRPPVDAVTLFGVTTDSLYIPLTGAVQRGADGTFRFSSTEFAGAVQRLLLETSPIDHFELGIPNALPTINTLVVYAGGSDRAPSAELTVTPITR